MIGVGRRGCPALANRMIGVGRRGCPAFDSVVAVFPGAGAADHDLVLLDRDLDGPVARPVLRVDRVVLDGGVEPQAVALLAVVEGALERRLRGPAARAAAAPGGALGLGLLLFLLGGLARGLLGGAGLVLGRLARGLLG